MRIKRGDAHQAYAYWTVRIDPNELDCGYKLYPFGTCIGTIRENGTINPWTPCGYKPRGFMGAARLVLETARDQLRAEGKVK